MESKEKNGVGTERLVVCGKFGTDQLIDQYVQASFNEFSSTTVSNEHGWDQKDISKAMRLQTSDSRTLVGCLVEK